MQPYIKQTNVGRTFGRMKLIYPFTQELIEIIELIIENINKNLLEGHRFVWSLLVITIKMWLKAVSRYNTIYVCEYNNRKPPAVSLVQCFKD